MGRKNDTTMQDSFENKLNEKRKKNLGKNKVGKLIFSDRRKKKITKKAKNMESSYQL